MTLSRRALVKLGLTAGAAPLVSPLPLEPDGGRTGCPTPGPRARPLPLDRVRLLGGPLEHARELDARYLLALQPDRMLAYYRMRAGLEPRGEPYGGWDGDGRNLTGHVAGHYLSGVSLMWAATGDERFRERAAYLVRELKEVQDAHGDGYLSALAGGRRAFGELAAGRIRSAAFDLNGEWSPWYTLHKTFAGLRDAYRFTGDRTALLVETAFAAWVEGVVGGLDEEQVQLMLNTEFGGMNEVMVDLHADTGDRRWLALSYRFEHFELTLPLARHQDVLAARHGNTQIPKLLGSADRYALEGAPNDLLAAAFFWDRVVQHHSFATGGHGTDEYFGPADRLDDRVDGRTAETCNVYNMLKLTRRLFALRPDPLYADFHERALFNHILASIDPADGRTCYMVPVGRGVTHEYQRMNDSFTCCVGSGMESHALHADGIYYADGGRLWVNLYVPSRAEWSEAGLRVETDTPFPEGGSARIRLALDAPRELTLVLRRPHWAGEGFRVRVNGAPWPLPPLDAAAEREPGSRLYASSPVPVSSWVELRRTWQTGDAVELDFPFALRAEPLPDNPSRLALLWGPLVLAGDLGPEPEDREGLEPPWAPVFVVEGGAGEAAVSDWLEQAPGEPGRFRTRDGVAREPDAGGRPRAVDLVPFYKLHRRTYSTYWDVFSPAEWEARRAGYAAEAEERRRVEAATVAFLQPGEVVFEREYGYEGPDDSAPQRILGRPGRRGRSWFSFAIPVDPDHPMVLRVTYFSDDRRATPAHFDLLVDDRPVAEQSIARHDERRFFDVDYAIPHELVAGRERVRVRFQARPDSQIATAFGLRMLRGDLAPPAAQP